MSNDRFGNRWQQNGPQTFLATFTGNSPGNPQNNNRIDGYTHDAAGNIMNDGLHGYTFDAENRMIKVDGGSTATYSYDVDGHRVEKVTATGNYSDPAGTWIFLYDQSGRYVIKMNSNYSFVEGQIYAGSRHLASVGGWMTFSHSDWVGTERFRTYMASVPYTTESCTSLPFGDGLNCTGSDVDPLHFTGKERDSASGLDNFTARYFGSSLGRFMSPDDTDSEDHMGDPQGLNLYGYVQNSPTNTTDPDGHDCVFVVGNTVGLQRGDCSNAPSNATNVTYVPGTVDKKSAQYNPDTGILTVNYTPYGSDQKGIAVIGDVNPTHPGPTEFEKFASRIAAGADNVNAFVVQVGIQVAAGAAGRAIGAGVDALLAARGARAAVDLTNVSAKIARQMVTRCWTQQLVVDTIAEANQSGSVYQVVNKATGGAATEYVASSTGKFVVVDNATKQVLQVSGPGFLPNHLVP